MSSLKGDFGRGLIVVGPVLVTLVILYILYSFIARFTPAVLINADVLGVFLPGVNEFVLVQLAALLRVLTFIALLCLAMYGIGQTTDTTTGEVLEGVVDYLANRVPLIRVVYNASKTATETALGAGDTLQTPVTLETWNGLRMTAFKTGRTTTDGRVLLFLPTSPNITTGFVLEVSPDEITELDETVEEALTRVVSAGFGDADRAEADIDELSLSVVGEMEIERGPGKK